MSTLSPWTRRDPFTEFDALVRNVFGPIATRSVFAEPAAARFTPAVEVTRDGDDAVVRVEVPGVDVEKDVTVEVDRGRLVVRGERRENKAEERDGRNFSEVRYGSFRRVFNLPQHVTAEAVTASYDAGVLSVRVAGAYAGTQAQRIAVTAGGAPELAATEEKPESAE